MIETQRLILRRWKESDLDPLIAMNADTKVMEFFPSTLSPEESEKFLERIGNKFEADGFCFWAMELKATKEFIGFVGLNKPAFQTHFTPCIEIGWRLPFQHWGKGYATEGAIASIQYGFSILKLKEIVSFTTVNNVRSQKVMEPIGMTHHPMDDFDHPNLESHHPLRKHVL
jgi:3-dehydroquinate dehydratase/shikimate dehydrogenase